MTLIITRPDYDGAYCAGYLGQKFPDAEFFIANYGTADRIKSTGKKLIIIAGISISQIISHAIDRRLKYDPETRFIIFDHHYNYPYIKLREGVELYWDSTENTPASYILVKKWINGSLERTLLDQISRSKPIATAATVPRIRPNRLRSRQRNLPVPPQHRYYNDDT